MDDTQSLREEIRLKKQQLELVQAIDKIRDSHADPGQVFQGEIEMVCRFLDADAGCLFLMDPSTGGLRLQASIFHDDTKQALFQYLSQSTLEKLNRFEQVTLWRACTNILPDLPEGFYGIIVPIQLNTETLGCILLFRKMNPFTVQEIQLLETAEDQLDSLVLHEVVLSHHQQTERELEFRRRELDMLMSLDAIRDSEPQPVALLSAVVNLLADRLQSDLCLLFLIDRESDAEELKALHDRGRCSHLLQPLVSMLLKEETGWTNSLNSWTITQESLPFHHLEDTGDLHLASVPINLNDEPLGFLLLIRVDSPFSQTELMLLEKAECQIDSAIMQGILQDQFQQTRTEVDTIYQIDQIRDKDISMDEMLNHVLQVMVERINSEMGFIALYDRLGERLELRATTQQDLYQSWSSYPVFEGVMNDALEQGNLVARQNLAPNLHSIACLPLFLNEQVIGVLGMVNRSGRPGFSKADQRTLKAIGSQIDTAIYERREIRMLRQVLGRSVDPRVMDRLLTNPSLDVLKPERLELTVLYADVRGSTNLAEQTDPETLVEFIRDYLSQMTEVIFAHDGMVDKFVGDEVMALFGAPIPQQDHAIRAVRTGLAMQERHQQLMVAWRKKGLPAPPIGIGIVTGRMIIGEMGGSQRANYTVISREANLGARICSVAEGGQVLISESTYQQVRERVVAVAISGQQFKGVERPVTVYHIKKVLD